MLDNVFARLKQEIAIDGARGTCIDDVWAHVKVITTSEIVQREGELSTPVNIDMAYKCYVWRFIRRFPELLFYEKLDRTGQNEDDLNDNNSENDLIESSDNSCDGKVRPFTQLKLKYGLTKNFRLLEDIGSLEYGKVVEKYGDRLYVIATPQYQKEQLLFGVPPGPEFTQNLIVLLQRIIKSRHDGITQADITRLYDLDPRSTGHYVKSLEKMGAITRTTYSYARIRTNMCVHIRFSRIKKLSQPDEEEEEEDKAGDNDEKTCPYNVNTLGVVFSAKSLLHSITELLLDAKDNVMFTDDILNALGFNSKKKGVRKWFNRAIDIMCLRGYLKKFVAKENNVGRQLRCLKLLKTELSMKKQHSILLKELPKENSHNRTLVVPRIYGKPRESSPPVFYRGFTLEFQIINTLRSAGVHGITQRNIGREANCIDSRMLYRALERMVVEQGIAIENYGVCRHLEFEGRNRRYRYFTYINYKKVVEDKDVFPIKYETFTPDESLIVEHDYLNQLVITPIHWKKPSQRLPLLPRPKRPEPDIERDYASVNNSPAFDLVPLVVNPDAFTKQLRGRHKKRGRPVENKPKPRKRKTRSVPEDEESSEYGESETESTKGKKSYQGRVTRATKRTSLKTLEKTEPESTPSNTSKVETRSKVLPEHVNPSKEIAEVLDQCNIVTSTPESLQPEIMSVNLNPLSIRTGKDQILSSQATESQIPQKRTDISVEHYSQPKAKKPSTTLLSDPKTFTRPKTRSTATRQTTLFELFSARPKEPKTLNAKQNVSNEQSATFHINGSSTKAIKDKEVSKSAGSLTREPDQEKCSPSISQAFLELGPVNHKVGEVPEVPEEIQNTTTNGDRLSRKSRPTRMYGKDNELIPKDNTIIPPINKPGNTSHIAPERKSQKKNRPALDDNYEGEDEDYEDEGNEDEDDEDEDDEDEDDENHKGSLKLKSNDKDTATELKLGFTQRSREIKAAKGTTNLYMLQRKAVILALLESYPIMERNFHFKRLFEDKTKEMFGESLLPTSIVCIKTIWRAVEELARENVVCTREVTLSNISGKKAKRDILFRRDIEADGEIMNDYLKYVGKGEAIWKSIRTPVQFEKIEQPERLLDRMARMEAEHNLAVEEKNITEAVKIQGKLKKFRKNVNLARAYPEKLTNPASSRKCGPSKLLIGLKYGFISSKFIRAKRLHQYLNNLLSRNVSDVDPETRQIPIVRIIQNLTFGEYLKIIGIFFESTEIQEFANGLPSNYEIILSQLPINIQDILFSRKTRLLRRLRIVLDVLEGFEIIERGIRGTTSLDNYFSNWTVDTTKVCTLNSEVPMRDVLHPDQVIIRTYSICTPADIQIFWSDLQYRCTNQPVKLADIRKLQLSNSRRSFVSGMFFLKNWKTTYQMSAEQKKILESYVDRVNKTTPLKENDICNKAAEESEMNITMVRAYYRKVEVSFLTRQEKISVRMIERHVHGRKRFRKPRIQQNIPMGQNSLKEFSGIFKLSRSADHLNDETIYPNWYHKISLNNMLGINKDADERQDKNGSLDFFTDVQYKLLDDKTGRKRYSWSDQEDDLLIYGYAIVAERLKGHRFMWGALSRVFSDRTTSSLRNRLKRLHETASAGSQIKILRHLWGDIYKKGCNSGAIVEDEKSIHDNIHFNLLGQVHYFLEQLQEAPSTFAFTSELILSTSTEFKKNIVKPQEKKLYEDIYHAQITRLAKKAVLCYNTPRLRFSPKGGFNTGSCSVYSEMNRDKRSVSFLKIFIMMILLTPEDKYEPYFAYAILQKFPVKLVTLAVDAFSDEGSIIKNSRYRRRIPGRKEGLSHKFSRYMNGEAGLNFSIHAKGYEQYITERRDVEFMPLNSGKAIMACILDLFSDGRLRLDIKDKSNIEGPKVMFHSKSRSIESSHAYFDIKMKLETPRKQYDIPNIGNHNENVVPLQEDAFEDAFDNLYIKNNILKTTASQIVNKLSKMGSDGATLWELKEHIKILSINITDDHIFKAIGILTKNDPPLVARVGFEAYRFVLTIYLENWLIVPSGVIIPKPSDPEKKAIVEELAKVRKPAINLRRWNDLSGSRIDRVWRISLQSILELVMTRPGIFTNAIQQHFKNRFTPIEVEDLLENLVESRALKKLVVQCNTRKVCIFGNSSTFEVRNSSQIDSGAKTCYWTISGYYNRI